MATCLAFSAYRAGVHLVNWSYCSVTGWRCAASRHESFTTFFEFDLHESDLLYCTMCKMVVSASDITLAGRAPIEGLLLSHGVLAPQITHVAE